MSFRFFKLQVFGEPPSAHPHGNPRHGDHAEAAQKARHSKHTHQPDHGETKVGFIAYMAFSTAKIFEDRTFSVAELHNSTTSSLLFATQASSGVQKRNMSKRKMSTCFDKSPRTGYL